MGKDGISLGHVPSARSPPDIAIWQLRTDLDFGARSGQKQILWVGIASRRMDKVALKYCANKGEEDQAS